jgi:hypothetical protein
MLGQLPGPRGIILNKGTLQGGNDPRGQRFFLKSDRLAKGGQ